MKRIGSIIHEPVAKRVQSEEPEGPFSKIHADLFFNIFNKFHYNNLYGKGYELVNRHWKCLMHDDLFSKQIIYRDKVFSPKLWQLYFGRSCLSNISEDACEDAQNAFKNLPDRIGTFFREQKCSLLKNKKWEETNYIVWFPKGLNLRKYRDYLQFNYRLATAGLRKSIFEKPDTLKDVFTFSSRYAQLIADKSKVYLDPYLPPLLAKYYRKGFIAEFNSSFDDNGNYDKRAHEFFFEKLDVYLPDHEEEDRFCVGFDQDLPTEFEENEIEESGWMVMTNPLPIAKRIGHNKAFEYLYTYNESDIIQELSDDIPIKWQVKNHQVKLLKAKGYQTDNLLVTLVCMMAKFFHKASLPSKMPDKYRFFEDFEYASDSSINELLELRDITIVPEHPNELDTFGHYYYFSKAGEEGEDNKECFLGLNMNKERDMVGPDSNTSSPYLELLEETIYDDADIEIITAGTKPLKDVVI